MALPLGRSPGGDGREGPGHLGQFRCGLRQEGPKPGAEVTVLELPGWGVGEGRSGERAQRRQRRTPCEDASEKRAPGRARKARGGRLGGPHTQRPGVATRGGLNVEIPKRKRARQAVPA